MSYDRLNLAGKTVLVGMTGRTDSSVAAFLLKKQGMKVIGLSIITTDADLASKPEALPKCHIRDLEAVKELCEKMQIPFYATNSKPRFESEVIDRIVSNKLTAMANSSCFYCSQTRMHVLYEKMLALKADFIATGHFAKTRMNISSKEFYIHSAADEDSDQSFLLAGTPNHILEKLLLPLGDLSKKEVKKYAGHFSLPSDPSLEQEGFCFRSKSASKKLLESRLPKSFVRTGPVENLESGHNAGEHEGMIYHYITEKEPKFTSSVQTDKRYEIVGYDYKRAAIFLGMPERLSFEGVQLTRSALSSGVDRSVPLSCFVKFKYSKTFLKAALYFKNNNTMLLEFKEKVYPLIPGEAIVVYDSDTSSAKVLGWGLVGQRGRFEPINRVQLYEESSSGDQESAPRVENSLFRF